MPVIFDFTETLAYEEGEAKGKAEGKAEGEAKAIEKLLRKGILTPFQIADSLEVPLQLVLDIQKGITKV